jgi:hypothetical protein
MGNQSDQRNGEQYNAEARKPVRASASTRSTAKKKIEIQEIARSNLPPVRRRNEDFVQKHYRLSRFYVGQSEALAHQRHKDAGDLVRQQFELGVNVDSALGPVGENGTIGNYKPQRLAEILDPITNSLIAFQINNGVVPTIIQEYRTTIHALGETLQALQMQLQNLATGSIVIATHPHVSTSSTATEAATEVDEEGDAMADMFFGKNRI